MAVMALAVRKRDRIRFTLIGFACLFFILTTDYMGFFQGMNSHIYDLCFRLRGPGTPTDQIVIAAIDENTLEKLGKWPISRSHYGTFLDRVSNASAIVFDIILAEPSPQDPGLEPAISKGKIFLPVYFDNSGHLVPPSPLLGSPSVGHVHLEPSVDGVSRQVFHTLIQDGKPFSSLASVVHDFLFPSDRKAPPLAFPGTGSQNENTILQLDPMRINFYGPRGTFPYLSFSDILENKFPGTFFDNKIIMVGLTAAGIDQDHLTPFYINRIQMPGVEIQANILNNLMDGTNIKEVSNRLMRPVLFLVLFSSFFLFVQMGTPRSVMVWAAASIVLSTVTFFLLSRFHIWVAPVVFYAALTAALVIAHIFNLERMGALLFQAKKDWEISFDSITDAIIIQDRSNRTILSKRSAKDGPGDFFDRYFKLCANPSLDPSTLSLSIWDDTENYAEIFDTTLERYFESRRFSRKDEKTGPMEQFISLKILHRGKTLKMNRQCSSPSAFTPRRWRPSAPWPVVSPMILIIFFLPSWVTLSYPQY